MKSWRSGRIARPVLYAIPVFLLAIAVIFGSAFLRKAASDYDMFNGKTSLQPTQWPSTSATIAYLGHATLLMNYFGVRVISDPTLFPRVGLAVDSLFTVGPHRLVSAPLGPERLQAIDVILI